jgi:hypothetical protein
MVEDDPDYNCCYETDESNVNPVCMGQLNPGAYPTIQCVGVGKRGTSTFQFLRKPVRPNQIIMFR